MADNKKYTSDELKDLSKEELREKIGEDQDQLNNTRFGHTVSPLENPNVLKEMRRNVARLKTELRAREIAEKNNA